MFEVQKKVQDDQSIVKQDVKKQEHKSARRDHRAGI